MADFSTALSTWKEINLSQLQRSLDATALELVENQKDNMIGRKKLAEQTREFKKIPDDAKVEAIKSLLKAYQGEIDQLTRRSKVSESAFLSTYKLLAEAPDPYPLLDAAVDQTVKVAEARVLESELNRLREENADLKSQVSEMSSVDERRRKAEQRADSLEDKMEELIQERVTQKENELNATYDERMRNYEEREQDLLKQVKTVKDQVKDLRTSSDSTQAKLMDASQRQDVEVIAKLGELDMIVADLERANGRVASMERRNEMLRAEIESVKSGSQQVDRVKGLETQVAELETEASRLLKGLDSEKESKRKLDRDTAKRIEDLGKDLASKTTEIEGLRDRAKQYVDYDDIKRELEIMKFVEFGGGENDDGPQLPDPKANRSSKQTAQSLESLLTAKNRKALEELTRLRVSHEDLSHTATTLEETLASTKADLDKQRALNERLENDLLHINNSQREREAAIGSVMESTGSTSGLSGLDLGVKAGNADPGRATPPTTSSADTSILPIVTSQRDRFRARNAELEEELRRQFETISELRSEVKSLQADNLKLYEKVRYVGSYREDSSSSHAGPSGSSGGGGGGGGLAGIGLNTRGGDDIGRYKDKYDESLNPFEAFKGREAQRAIQALNPIERAVFALCRAIIGNRRARSLFVIYASGLHLLVMLSIWGSLNTGAPLVSSPISPVH